MQYLVLSGEKYTTGRGENASVWRGILKKIAGNKTIVTLNTAKGLQIGSHFQ